MTKTADRIYALLSICISLSPTRLEESIHSVIRDKYGEALVRIQRGDQEAIIAYQDLFVHACPKFVNPVASSETVIDRVNHQLIIFLSLIRPQLRMPIIKSFLKLYTTVGLERMANFLDMDESEVLTQLLVFKQSSRQKRWTEGGGLLDGRYACTSDLDFCIKKVNEKAKRQENVQIAESKMSRRYADWFLRNGAKFQEITQSLHTKILASDS